MTAASAYPPGSEQGSSQGRAAEPSMEDILASIRRIIADDQQATGSRAGSRRAQPANAAVAAAGAPPIRAADPEEPLDLARFAAAGAEAPESDTELLGGVRHDDAAEQADHDAAGEHARGVAIHPSEHQAQGTATKAFAVSGAFDAAGQGHDEALLAPPMSESVMSAFEALAATVVLENKPMLEGILRDLLRPMLKAWLDDNLPGLVERLVRVEIERVARGGRS